MQLIPHSLIQATFHDRLEGSVVNSAGLLSNKAGLEQDFWATEPLGAHGDDVTIRQLVGLLLRCVQNLFQQIGSGCRMLLGGLFLENANDVCFLLSW